MVLKAESYPMLSIEAEVENVKAALKASFNFDDGGLALRIQNRGDVQCEAQDGESRNSAIQVAIRGMRGDVLGPLPCQTDMQLANVRQMVRLELVSTERDVTLQVSVRSTTYAA